MTLLCISIIWLLLNAALALELNEPTGPPYLSVRQDLRLLSDGSYADTPVALNARLGFNVGVFHLSQNLPDTK